MKAKTSQGIPIHVDAEGEGYSGDLIEWILTQGGATGQAGVTGSPGTTGVGITGVHGTQGNNNNKKRKTWLPKRLITTGAKF
jgi:hypothetical protein